QGERAAAVFAYFAARVGGGLDRGKIDVGHVDARLHGTNEFPREVSVARRIASFDESLQLPIVRGVGVIMKGLAQANGRLALLTLRPQPQINTEESALGRGARKDFGDELGLANEVLTQRDRAGGFGSVIQV